MKAYKAFLALCAMGMAVPAAAQTCASPLPFGNSTQIPGSNVSGDTCTATNSITDICNEASPSPGNDIVYRTTVNSAGPDGYTATAVALTTSSPTFNPVIALIGPNVACSGDATCLRTASTGGAGAGESMNVAGLSNGTYFFIISADPGGSTCGAFQFTASGGLGTFPVALQNFSID
jgi:hypothetical protein